MNRDDRRIRKTKKALRESLAELMLEKELRNITVKELTDNADVHRATFYAHYGDIYDLYEQLENAVIDELGAIITADSSDTYEGLFKSILDYVYENSKTCRMLFKANGSRNFYDRISDFFESKYLEDWLHESGEKNVTEEWRFFTRYHIQGCLAVFSRWAENDYAYPKEKLADIIVGVNKNFDEYVP